jgi:hypothetical protein
VPNQGAGPPSSSSDRPPPVRRPTIDIVVEPPHVPPIADADPPSSDLPPVVFVQPPPAPPIVDTNPPPSDQPPVVFVQPPAYPPPSPPVVMLVPPPPVYPPRPGVNPPPSDLPPADPVYPPNLGGDPPPDALAGNDTRNQPKIDTPPLVDPPVIPPIYPPYVGPAVAGGGSGCVLRWVGPTLYYLRRDLQAAFPVRDFDVARVKCDFSGEAGSCISGFPIDDPDPSCRLGPSVVIREELQMDHCLHGTIDMSRALNCLPVLWVKTSLVQMDGQLYYVRLDSKTIYPVTKGVADRKGLTDVTNCDLALVGFCRSIRRWNAGPSVQVDTCLAGTFPMSRAPACTPPL